MLSLRKIPKIISLGLVSLSILILGVFVGFAYGKTLTIEAASKRITDCTKNIDNINWNSFIKVSTIRTARKAVVITYKNNNSCFNFDRISTKLIVYNSGKIDTINFTLKEQVKALQKITLDITEIECDSIKPLQSIVEIKSINL